jgi:hypothetical protein
MVGLFVPLNSRYFLKLYAARLSLISDFPFRLTGSIAKEELFAIRAVEVEANAILPKVRLLIMVKPPEVFGRNSL